MNTQIHRETAQILQFPPPELRARLRRAAEANLKQIPKIEEMPTTVIGGAWYHEAAIHETDRPRKP